MCEGEREEKREAGGLLPVAYIPLVMPALAFNSLCNGEFYKRDTGLVT